MPEPEILTMGNSFRVNLYRPVTTPVEEAATPVTTPVTTPVEGGDNNGKWVILKEYREKKR